MMYTPDTEDETRRAHALDQAIRMVTGHGGFRTPEDAVMSAARTFENYLEGPAPELTPDERAEVERFGIHDEDTETRRERDEH